MDYKSFKLARPVLLVFFTFISHPAWASLINAYPMHTTYNRQISNEFYTPFNSITAEFQLVSLGKKPPQANRHLEAVPDNQRLDHNTKSNSLTLPQNQSSDNFTFPFIELLAAILIFYGFYRKHKVTAVHTA